MQCQVSKCSNKHKGHGYCQMHLIRLKKHGDLKLHYAVKHGAKHTPEYRAWENMKQRCLNPNQNTYEHYGGRGITITERWLKFENFYADMGKKPSPKHSLDRINVDGNYEPANCRWADWYTQNYNQRLRKNNEFGHKGIVRDVPKNGYGFNVYISYRGEKTYLGHYLKIEDAIEARKRGEAMVAKKKEEYEKHQ